jgi:poly(hydroxyalkanoate) depolymerase family esterase
MSRPLRHRSDPLIRRDPQRQEYSPAMKWSRELRVARRSVRTAIRAASAIAAARARLPASPRVVPEPTPAAQQPASVPVEVPGFGSNPGRLTMLVQFPTRPLMPGAPLIVLLHGCGQGAAGFARETDWVALADRLGIPLLLPEQSDANNQGRCFNWFRPMHTGRGQGEALSIRQMVAAAVERFASDPGRVFIAGLSAGGAMTAALLAAYPDVFAAGAVVAGLPVGAAGSTSEALRRMAEAGPARSPADWAEQVRHAAPIGYPGPWPRVSIWHGEADGVVDPANSRLLGMQWSALHGLDSVAPDTLELLGMRRERWTTAGRPVVERWSLPGVAHEWPHGAARGIVDFWDIAVD